MPLSSVIGASSILKPGVCTSTTRPAVPFEGQTIYETDTDLVRSYNGSSWVTVGPTTVPAQTFSAVGFNTVETYQTTGSTSYTDLATAGPSVTLTTGTSAYIIASCLMYDVNNDGTDCYMSISVSGATTLAASNTWCAYVRQDQNLDLGVVIYQLTGLTAGSNTFKMQYRRAGGTTGGFDYRRLLVIA